MGALENVNIHKPDKFITVEYEGKQISILRDLQLFRQHFLEISPEDKIEIENLITYIKAFENISMPSEKPIDLMNLWEIIQFIRSMKNAGKILKILSRMSIEEYCSSFKSPLIKKVLGSIMLAKYSASSLIFTLASFTGSNSDLAFGRIKGNGGADGRKILKSG